MAREVDHVVIARGFQLTGVGRALPVAFHQQRPHGGNFGTDQIDPRIEAAGHHGLSASLTATVYHDRLAVPLGLSGNHVDRTDQAHDHLVKEHRVAVVPAEKEIFEHRTVLQVGIIGVGCTLKSSTHRPSLAQDTAHHARELLTPAPLSVTIAGNVPGFASFG